MSDDDRNVSAREWRAVREGDAHAAPKTSQNNTPESFIVGVGASGALLAGAAIVFVTLVGLVSFNVWPTAQDATTDGNVELSAATPNAPAKNTVVPLSAAAGQLAATNVGTPGTPAGTGGGGNGGNSQGGNGQAEANQPTPTPSPTPTAPGTTPTPPDSGGSTGTGDGSTGSRPGQRDQGPVARGVADASFGPSPEHPGGRQGQGPQRRRWRSRCRDRRQAPHGQATCGAPEPAVVRSGHTAGSLRLIRRRGRLLAERRETAPRRAAGAMVAARTPTDHHHDD